MMTGFGTGWGILGMSAMMLLFWGGLVVLALLLIRGLFPRAQQNSSSPSGREPTALEILSQRYARGEVTRDQFDQMKRDLS